MDEKRFPSDAEMEKYFGEVDSPPSDKEVGKAYRKLRESIFGRNTGWGFHNILRYSGAVAACAALLITGTLLISRNSSSGESSALPVETTTPITWQECIVPMGQTRSISLSDGTVLHLNAGSRVTYPSVFQGAERRIFLDGEVFADVSHDPDHPFVIESGQLRVNVLGTRFDFKSYRDENHSELILVEGKVRLDIDCGESVRQVVMEKGTALTLDRKTADVEIKEAEPLALVPFHERKALYYYNIPLSDVASDLERTFGSRIIITDSRAADTRYFAVFSNGEGPEEILRALGDRRTGTALTVVRRGETIYVSSKKTTGK